MKAIQIICAAAILGAAFLVNTNAMAKERTTGRGTGPVIFVTSQGLYFDSIVVVDPLPMRGNFQQLIPGMHGLETEYGPGTPGHLGGRWWVDVNGDNQMDAGDHYFLCPLLGPGRPTP